MGRVTRASRKLKIDQGVKGVNSGKVQCKERKIHRTRRNQLRCGFGAGDVGQVVF